MMTVFDGCINGFVDGFNPPLPPRDIMAFARDTTLPDGPLAGTKINPDIERAVLLWLRMLASRTYQWHVLIAPSQRAKTTTGIMIPFLHGLIEDRVNIGYVMPNLDKLAQKWEGSLKPMIEGCGYGAYMPTKGPGSNGGRPGVLTIRHPQTHERLSRAYFMALGKGGSETATASNPCARLLIDEADDAENLGQIKLAMKRTASYGAAGGGIVTSTVNARIGRDLHPILELKIEGTDTRLAHLCPHCGKHVILDIECFSVEHASIVCPSCAVVWSESDRHYARNNAEYQDKNPDAEIFSVLYNQLDYFWEYPDPATGKVELVLPTLAMEARSAMAAKDRGDISPWNTYLRKSWCLPESEDDLDVPATIDMHLAARAAHEAYIRPKKPNRPEIPQGATVVTVGADTGKREAWWLALAMAPDLRWWVLDWSVKTTGDHRAEPSIQDQRNMLDALKERVVGVGRANAMGIDVGYNPDLVIPWARQHGFRLIRGDQRPSGKKDEIRNKPLPSWAEDRKQDDGSHWLFIDGAEVKKEIHKALARKPGEAGAGHIPRGQEAGDWLIRHITSEVWDSKHGVWVKKPGRDNHLLDCLVYAWAQAVILLNRPKAIPRKYGLIKSL